MFCSQAGIISSHVQASHGGEGEKFKKENTQHVQAMEDAYIKHFTTPYGHFDNTKHSATSTQAHYSQIKAIYILEHNGPRKAAPTIRVVLNQHYIPPTTLQPSLAKYHGHDHAKKSLKLDQLYHKIDIGNEALLNATNPQYAGVLTPYQDVDLNPKSIIGQTADKIKRSVIKIDLAKMIKQKQVKSSADDDDSNNEDHDDDDGDDETDDETDGQSNGDVEEEEQKDKPQKPQPKKSTTTNNHNKVKSNSKHHTDAVGKNNTTTSGDQRVHLPPPPTPQEHQQQQQQPPPSITAPLPLLSSNHLSPIGTLPNRTALGSPPDLSNIPLPDILPHIPLPTILPSIPLPHVALPRPTLLPMIQPRPLEEKPQQHEPILGHPEQGQQDLKQLVQHDPNAMTD